MKVKSACQVRSILVLMALMVTSFNLYAQGDGPRSFILLPKGVTGANVRWLGMDQNLLPSGTILVPEAEIDIDVFPITVFHTFSIAGRFAQVSAMINPGSVTASAKRTPPFFPLPVTSSSSSGISDGFFAFKMGLFGAPAMSVAEYIKSPMRFSIFGELRYWYSGSYDPKKAVNLGTGRGTYQIGLPMAIPLNNNLKRATWLEVSPALMLFADNDQPPLGSFAKKVEQSPVFSLETHLSHNFTEKFWVFANLLYRVGGRTTTDGVQNNNGQNMLGGGAGVGYQFLPYLGGYADYGTIFLGGPNDATSRMIRIAASFTYANVKKASKKTSPSGTKL